MENNTASSAGRHVHWNDLLPYPVPDGEIEMKLIFEDVKAALLKSDLLSLSTCAIKINQFIDMKLHLSHDSWKHLAQVSYELAVRPPISHAATMHDWASILLRILKLPAAKQYLSLGLRIEWRPMFDLIVKSLYQSTRESRLSTDEQCLRTVVKLAEKSRKFFDPSMADELLEECKKWLYPIQTRYLTQFVSLLVIFLPTSQMSEAVAELFKPTTGILWASSSRRVDALNMLLIARLCKSPVRIDWNTWAPALFNTLQRHLKLPGAEQGPRAISKWNPNEKSGNQIVRSLHSDFAGYFAKWLVRSINDDNSVLAALEQFLQSLDTFFHPSNYGNWSTELAHFLSAMVSSMNKRVHRKGLPYVLPELSSESMDRFVGCIWPAISKLLFSKNPSSSFTSYDVIKGLCNLSPKFILDQVASLAESSLETLTQPHRTNASLGALSAVARKLADQAAYPSGIAASVNFMHAVLPGIDSNDPWKTLCAVNFLTNAFLVTPLWDISPRSASGEEDSVENLNAESTAQFENFCLLFMDQSFHYLSCMAEPENDDHDGSSTLINCWDIFFAQLSPVLLDMVLEKILGWIKAESYIHAADVIGFLVGKAATRSSRYGSVLKTIISDIMRELGRGAGFDENQTDETCSKLIIYLNVLLRVLSFSGNLSILNEHKAELMVLFQKVSECKQYTVANLAAKCFKTLVKAVSGTYPIECTLLSVK